MISIHLFFYILNDKTTFAWSARCLIVFNLQRYCLNSSCIIVFCNAKLICRNQRPKLRCGCDRLQNYFVSILKNFYMASILVLLPQLYYLQKAYWQRYTGDSVRAVLARHAGFCADPLDVQLALAQGLAERNRGHAVT